MSNQKLAGVLRAFIDVTDSIEGEKVAEELRKLLHQSLVAQPAHVQRYWKIPEWFEVMIELKGLDEVELSWHLVEVLCSTWQVSKTTDELSAVWSCEMGGEVAHPKVRWLSVNFFPQ